MTRFYKVIKFREPRVASLRADKARRARALNNLEKLITDNP